VVLDDKRYVAFDSNVLTYFLDGNRGVYSTSPVDAVAEQRIAAVRLFFYSTPVIPPTVRSEARSIRHHERHREHIAFIDGV